MSTALTPSGVLMLLVVGGCAGLPTAGDQCEGGACDKVALDWDAGKQQFLARNNSDRWVRVTVKDDTMSVTVRIPAGSQGYIQYLTSRVGPYQADYE
jgi:hypothetical protein